MKKKINWKQIVGTAVSVILALSIIAFLFLASDSAELTQVQEEEQKTLTLDVDDSWEDKFIQVAENERFVLEANMKKAWLHLTDKKTGAQWWSLPEELTKQKKIVGAQNMQLASMISIHYANRDDNTALQTGMAGSVLKNNMNAKKIKNGARFEFLFANEGFIVPVEVTLDEHGMQASVCTSEIQEAGSRMQLTGVVLLAGFGSAPENSEGAFLLPDGSGMTVPYSKMPISYTARVYGNDAAVVYNTKETEDPTVLMPIYGYMQKNQGLMAVISDGGSRAKLRTVSPTRKSPYASVSSEMIYRESILVDVSQKTFEYTQVNMFEPEHTKLDRYTVRYLPCEGNRLTDLADSYRGYLMREEGLEAAKTGTDALQVEFLGGVTVSESVMGIPLKRVKPVTSYEQAGSLLNRMNKAGAGPITALYTNWAKGGSSSRLTVDCKPENALGGRNALDRLLADQKKAGNRIYLDLNLNEMGKSQHGYSSRYDAAQSVRREPSIQYVYLQSTFQVDKKAPMTFLLSPNKVLQAAQQAAKEQSLAPAGWAPSTLGNLIYSDFGSDNLDRGVGEKIYRQSLGELEKVSAGGLLLKQPCAYAFGHASSIQNAPAVSGHPLVEGESVPFYTMVLHGLVPMGGMPINRELQDGMTLLQSLECGTGLKVAMGAQDVDLLTQTTLASQSGIEAEAWMNTVVHQSAVLKNYLDKTDGRVVETYEILAPGVRKTVFEGGVGVIVNYNDYPVTAEGQQISAMGYAPIGW